MRLYRQGFRSRLASGQRVELELIVEAQNVDDAIDLISEAFVASAKSHRENWIESAVQIQTIDAFGEYVWVQA